MFMITSFCIMGGSQTPFSRYHLIRTAIHKCSLPGNVSGKGISKLSLQTIWSDRCLSGQLLDGTKLRFSQKNPRHSENMDYVSFSSDTQQIDSSERERNKNLTNYYTQMWIEIGKSEKIWRHTNTLHYTNHSSLFDCLFRPISWCNNSLCFSFRVLLCWVSDGKLK